MLLQRKFDKNSTHSAQVSLLLFLRTDMGSLLSKHRKVLFELAAGVNLVGLLLFNQFYTNTEIPRLAPNVFSAESQFCIQLWGAAYLAAARTDGFPGTCRGLSAVFCAEKMFYVWTWIRWLRSTSSFAPTDGAITKLFFYTYGLWDLICAVLIFAPAALCRASDRNSKCE